MIGEWNPEAAEAKRRCDLSDVFASETPRRLVEIV